MPIEIWVQSLLTGLSMGGVYALLASGLTLGYAVTRQLHLTHGDFLAIAIYASVLFSLSLKIDPYLSLLITAPILFGLGLLVFRFIVKPLLNVTPLITFQVYLGFIFVIENLLLNIFKSTPVVAKSFISMNKIHFGSSILLPLPQFIALMASLTIGGGLYILVNYSSFGRAVRAVAQDPEAASLMGIKVARIRQLTFGLAFILIAIAAALVSPWWRVQPHLGLDFTLFATIVLVVGGMGNFLGALLAGFLIGVLSGISTLLLGTTMALTIPYAAFLIVLVLRPQGILRGV